MIKGIAKRLDMEWSLSDRWGSVAQEAVDSANSEQMPVWSVLTPQVQKTNDVGRPDNRIVASRERPRLTDVKQALSNTLDIVAYYAKTKISMLFKRVVSAKWQGWLTRAFLKIYGSLN